MQSAESLKKRIEMQERNDPKEISFGSSTIKVADDSNSSEILSFLPCVMFIKSRKRN